MNGLSLLPLFLVGLLGGVHCIGMCGGIVSALSAAGAGKRIPIAVSTAGVAVAGASGAHGALLVLSYNLGRLASYAAAGAVAGGVAGAAGAVTGLQLAGYWLANLMLVALGLNLMGAWRGLAVLEAAGSHLWRRLQPLARHLLPMDSPGRALALGALWGWVPCGMVYSVLTSAMLSGSAPAGAAAMLAFGLGTLPMLLALGLLGQRLAGWSRRREARLAAGLLVLGFGLLGLLRATHGLPPGWVDALCLAPPGGRP